MLTKESYKCQLCLALVEMRQWKLIEQLLYELALTSGNNTNKIQNKLTSLGTDWIETLRADILLCEKSNQEFRVVNSFLKTFYTFFISHGLKVFFITGMIITDYRAQFYKKELVEPILANHEREFKKVLVQKELIYCSFK